MSTSALTIPDVVRHAASAWPDAVAIEDGETRLTFAELRSVARRAASALGCRGIGRGDAVAIWAPNRWEWVVAALGAHLRGAMLVPINTRYKGAEAGDILARTGAKLLFSVRDVLGTDLVGLLDGDAPPVVYLDDGFDAFLDEADPERPEAEVRPDDVSDVLFTSGTTGRPKGVLTTQAQTVRVFQVWSETVGLQAGDRYLVTAPFFHAFGYKAGWLACLLRGATMIPLPTFDVDEVLRRIAAERISVLPGPPALYQTLLAKGATQHDLSSLRLAVTGAAVVPESLVRRMREELGFATVLTAYGLTEATGVVTMCRPGDDDATIASTSGRAIPGVVVRVVGEDGRDAPPGEAGEVWVRGYNVMRGYLDDPDATESTVVDGWLRTGDVGVLDARGHLRITDRLKDMFIVGGFNAYPAEIERMLLDHPDVDDVAVIGVPDERLGEVGMAFVVGRRVDADALIAWARDRMANFKVPRHVRVVGALPRNASGKVRKDALRRQAEA